MLNEKELGYVLISIIVLVFAVVFKDILSSNLNYLNLILLTMFIALIILVNLLAKKLTAHYYQAELQTRTWHWQRFGFAREKRFKKPVPIGIIGPIVVTLLSQGNFLLMSVLESNIEGTSARAAKSHGRFRFTEMTDVHIGLIIASGVVANLVLAIIAYFLDLGQLATLSIYYAAYSVIPFGNLDGTKIFFGNKNLWATLTLITAIFLSYALFIPR